MLEAIIYARLKIFRPNNIAWIRKSFQISPSEVRAMVEISLCPYHGVGEKGVHRNTYGRLIKEVHPTHWDQNQCAWYFTAIGHSGREVQGVLWYQTLLDDSHLAVIEVVGPQPHVSAMQVDQDGEGYFLVGWKPNPALVGLEYLFWSKVGQAVFEEDRRYINEYGYQLGLNNPFRGVVQWQ